ncbi:MAG: universal stress protein [Actinomycetota bacterium]|nr:universal stress protein [Actinomycetota bacterium]
MHMLIATSGVLSPEPVVDFTRHLLGQNGRVTLMTVIEVPRAFLDDLHVSEGRGSASSDEQEEAVASYLDERGRKTVEPIRAALESARIPSEVRFVEGNDAAAVIADAATTLDVDIVVLGATRSIFNREAWESVSARVMLDSDCPVLVVPAPHRDDPRSALHQEPAEDQGVVEP